MEHTPTPWGLDKENPRLIRQLVAPGHVIGKVRITKGAIEANAHRIVACVNACEGIETETLQGFEGAEFNQVLKLCQQIDTVTKQNARLLEALKGYESHITKNFPWDLSEPLNTIHKAARAAIAEAENTEPPHTRATII